MRQNPNTQSNARADLEAQLENALTGIPEDDADIARSVRRDFLFGRASKLAQASPKPPNPFAETFSRIFGKR